MITIALIVCAAALVAIGLVVYLLIGSLVAVLIACVAFAIISAVVIIVVKFIGSRNELKNK